MFEEWTDNAAFVMSGRLKDTVTKGKCLENVVWFSWIWLAG
jgi:hypothetical protein